MFVGNILLLIYYLYKIAKQSEYYILQKTTFMTEHLNKKKNIFSNRLK